MGMSVKPEQFGDYSVKNVKSFQGREGYGFNCTLYRNGKKVGSCIDDASGGEMYPISWERNVDAEAEQKLLDEHITTIPKVKTDRDIELTVNEGWFVTDLVTYFELQRDVRKMAKQCKTKTLFRTPEQNRGSYSIIPSPCDDRMREHIRKKYGDAEIFNDVINEGNIPSVLGG